MVSIFFRFAGVQWVLPLEELIHLRDAIADYINWAEQLEKND